MKILYGVQGTGNGHVTRARALNRHFREYGLNVDFLFSGRERHKYFDMEEFGDTWRCCSGLTFCYASGRIKVLSTLLENDLQQLVRDIQNLDLSHYDLVLTDFEPITAWAAKLRGKPCLGIGHQYAFHYPVPKVGNNWLSRTLMRVFAPADYRLGLHWHHFNAPILPPIAEIHSELQTLDPEKIVVYLGFEEIEEVIQFLEPFEQWLFVIYGPFTQYQSFGNVQLKPFSRAGFCRDLATCRGVISNAGFELASETIQLGKKLLVKPLMGQMEQLSNARALELLGLGMSMETLDAGRLKDWLYHFEARQMLYPDVAQAIVQWIQEGNWGDVASLANNLWSKVRVPDAEQERSMSSSIQSLTPVA
jgi:uncharacterized protein (TIGR00661 family)